MFRIHHVLVVLCMISAAFVLRALAGETSATTKAVAPETEAKKIDDTILRYLDTLSLRKDVELPKSNVIINWSDGAQLATGEATASGRQATQPATQPGSPLGKITRDMAPVTVTGDNVVILRRLDKSGNETGPVTIKGKQLQINGMSIASDKNGDVMIVDGPNTLTAEHLKLGEADLSANLVGDLVQLNFNYTPQDQSSSYLGVGVEPPSEALRSQLNLAPGGGLLVTYIDEAGPSKSALQKHDILQKLDDQILVNAEQLVALIHMHSPGDSVTLTFLRQASPRTEKITVGHKAPEIQAQGDVKYTSQSIPVLSDLPVMGRLFRRDGSAADAHSITFSDGDMTAVLDSSQYLIVTDVKTGAIFHGPVATPEQWEKVPAHVRKKLAEWHDMVGPKKEVITLPAPKQ